ncbi:MAG: FKBP-type peptidyl-prolyl cis-trans isomerase [Gemmatimonadota bacterium]
MRSFLFVALGLALFSACDDPYQPRVVPCDDLLLSFTAAGPDTIQAATGVRYVDLKAGAGATASAGVIETNYSLYVDDALLESSCGRNVFTFPLGSAGGAIPAFQAGVTGMKEGGVRRLLIDAPQGYPQHPTLGGKDLLFDVHLVRVY